MTTAKGTCFGGDRKRVCGPSSGELIAASATPTISCWRRRWISEVHKRGFQSVIHTNASEATDMALVAIAAAERQYPGFVTRDRLEHNQFVTQEQLLRMKQLGVATNLFTNHIYYWGDLHYSTFAGPDRARDMDPAGSGQRLGIPFSLHSDASVTPVDPLFAMWTATARKTMSGRILGEDERITVLQALHAVTLGAAYLLGQDDKKGSIVSGKLADFTVLDRNPPRSHFTRRVERDHAIRGQRRLKPNVGQTEPSTPPAAYSIANSMVSPSSAGMLVPIRNAVPTMRPNGMPPGPIARASPEPRATKNIMTLASHHGSRAWIPRTRASGETRLLKVMALRRLR